MIVGRGDPELITRIKNDDRPHWEISSMYDLCPICKNHSFIMHTRTQAVHHIYDCLAQQKIREVTKDG